MYSTLTASRQNEAPATPRLMYLGGFLPASRETTGAEILQTRVREFNLKGAEAGGRLGEKRIALTMNDGRSIPTTVCWLVSVPA